MIFVAGGQLDPNVGRLLRRLLARGETFVDLLVGPELLPRIRFSLDGPLELDGRAIDPLACFVRHDVFLSQRTDSVDDHRAALNWYHAVKGWALSRPNVRLFNRAGGAADYSKVANLAAAREAGLAVPPTVVANMFEPWPGAMIMKPVAGGELTRAADPLREPPPYPHFLQPRLSRPELRVYRVGERYFGFSVESPDLDYRERQQVKLAAAAVPDALARAFGALCDRLGLDFAAGDFMRDAAGEWLFLEVNSQPMFAAFDDVVSGSLCDAMIDWLRQAPQGAR